MKGEKSLLFNLSKILSLLSVDEGELYYALLDKANVRLRELIRELTRLIETYNQLPIEVKIEWDLERIKWKKNGDGSLWAKASPGLKKLLEENDGKIMTEKYTVYLTKGGYLKAYPRGEKR